MWLLLSATAAAAYIVNPRLVPVIAQARGHVPLHLQAAKDVPISPVVIVVFVTLLCHQLRRMGVVRQVI